MRSVYDPGGARVHPTEWLFFDVSGASRRFPSETERESTGGSESALALLRFADLGIDDIKIVEEGIVDTAGESRSRKSVRLVHRASGQLLPFDMTDESEGTRTWFRLIGPVLQALRTGNTLIFDEIDASLHPRLSAR